MTSYFQHEKQALAYSQLQYMLGYSFMNRLNKLRAILYDLNDLGLIEIQYKTLKKDLRNFKSFKLYPTVEE